MTRPRDDLSAARSVIHGVAMAVPMWAVGAWLLGCLLRNVVG